MLSNSKHVLYISIQGKSITKDMNTQKLKSLTHCDSLTEIVDNI